MFSNDEKNELVGRLQLILEQEKAGRADGRKELAEKLVEEARGYLKGRYKTPTDQVKKNTGFHTAQETVRPEDFA